VSWIGHLEGKNVNDAIIAHIKSSSKDEGKKEAKDEKKDEHKIERKNNCGKRAETISMGACNKALQIDHSASGCDFPRFLFARFPPAFPTIFHPASFLLLF